MRNRWLIALAAIGLHISIGSVYAWSVLTRPIMADMGFTMSQTTWTFSLAILMLGLSAGFLGSFAEKIGPKKSGLLAMLFWVAGLLGTAYALSVHNLTLLYLFYGIIGGIGLGYWLYNTSFYTGKILSKSSWICHGISHYGFWICFTHCRTAYAIPRSSSGISK